MTIPDQSLQHQNLETVSCRDTRWISRLPGIVVAAMMAALCTGALAERADRDQPVNIEADSVEIDDQKQEAVFRGNVVLTQGTLTLKADRIVVLQNKSGFQYGVAHGKPAYFRQKREGTDEYIEGEAERLEYNSEAEKVELFTNAKLKRGGDEVRGDYIAYNALTEFFEVTGGSDRAASGGSGRVRAIIQPRNSEDDKPAPSSSDTNAGDDANP